MPIASKGSDRAPGLASEVWLPLPHGQAARPGGMGCVGDGGGLRSVVGGCVAREALLLLAPCIGCQASSYYIVCWVVVVVVCWVVCSLGPRVQPQAGAGSSMWCTHTHAAHAQMPCVVRSCCRGSERTHIHALARAWCACCSACTAARERLWVGMGEGQRGPRVNLAAIHKIISSDHHHRPADSIDYSLNPL